MKREEAGVLEEVYQGEVKYYANRFLNGLIAVAFAGVLYIVFSKGMLEEIATPAGQAFIYILVGCAILVGLVSLYKAVDPNPVVVMAPEGIHIRTFLFIKHFIPWSEISNLNEKVYKNRVHSGVGATRVRTTMLQIQRQGKRPISINLTLLNKRGDAFYQDLDRYLAS